MATINISDPGIKIRTSTGGTYSSSSSAPTRTPVKPKIGQAIPVPPGGATTGYGTPAQSATFSGTTTPPPPVTQTPSYSDAEPTVEQPKPRYYAPVAAPDQEPTYIRYPYVHNVTVLSNVSIGTLNTPGGSNTSVQFNSGNSFDGDPGFTYDPTTEELRVDGNIHAVGVLTDNLLHSNGVAWALSGGYGDSNVATYLTTYSGLLSGTLTTAAQPNVTSLGTLTSLGVTGNIAAGGILSDNLYYANGTPRSFGGTQVLSITPEVFRGTGSQTVFILSLNPNGINNTQVFISGVYQQKATYTCVGTTLTFSEAPPAPTISEPDNIEILIYRLV